VALASTALASETPDVIRSWNLFTDSTAECSPLGLNPVWGSLLVSHGCCTQTPWPCIEPPNRISSHSMQTSFSLSDIERLDTSLHFYYFGLGHLIFYLAARFNLGHSCPTESSSSILKGLQLPSYRVAWFWLG
jgi:hypothetical protein